MANALESLARAIPLLNGMHIEYQRRLSRSNYRRDLEQDQTVAQEAINTILSWEHGLLACVGEMSEDNRGISPENHRRTIHAIFSRLQIDADIREIAEVENITGKLAVKSRGLDVFIMSLDAAIEFWQEKIESNELTVDEEFFATRRLVHLKEQLSLVESIDPTNF